MKKFLLFIFSFVYLSVYAQQWDWAKNAGGTDYETGKSVAADANGNVYVTGYFQSSSITFGSITLTNAGGVNMMYIVKYDSSGNALWAESAGGTSDGWGSSVAADANGNVFVTGHFYSSTITFGSTVLTNASAEDIFIVKYDNSGNVLWAESVGGVGNERGLSVAVDANGNGYVTGYFGPSITFGSTTLTNAGYFDMFVAKLGLSTGVNEWSDEEKFSLYPNPSSGIFNVQMRNCQAGTKVTVRDVLGNCLLEKNCRGKTSQEINLSCQPKGIYFVEIYSKGQSMFRKIVLN